MKTIATITIGILTLCEIVNAQTPNWIWARSAGGLKNDYAYGIAKDDSGNVYVTGYFDSDSITFGSTTLINAGSNGTSDIYLVKYGAGGNVLWVKSAGGTTGDMSLAIAIEAGGHVYITGYFYSPTITFGSFTLMSGGGDAVFVTKYDPGGNVIWAKSAIGTYNEKSNAITTDAGGNVYITGEFGSDSISFDNIILSNSGPSLHTDFFIVKYDAGGNAQWAKSAGGASPDEGTGISTDTAGNVYVSGRFESSSITFGSTSLTNTSVYCDIFVVKFDANGNVIWANRAGGTGPDECRSLATDANGNVYITGDFESGTINFGGTTVTNFGIFQDIFIVKYDAGGNVIWAKNGSGSSYDIGLGICTDAGEQCFCYRRVSESFHHL